MRSAARRYLSWIIAAVVFFCVRDALAYCRLTTCDPNRGEACEMNEAGCVRSGAGLRWPSLPIEYRFSAQGTTKLDEEGARDAVRRAFDHWANVECPNGGRTSLSFKEVADTRSEDAHSTIYFRDDEWTHDEGEESLALTNHDYTKYNGIIKSANIEINTATQPFSVGEGEAGLDLEMVVTHEVGHYIGIAHSLVSGSIMAPRYCQDANACGVAELSDDDIAAVCLIYPPTGVNGELAPLAPPSQGCSTTPSESPALPFTCLVGIALVVAVRRIRISRPTS